LGQQKKNGDKAFGREGRIIETVKIFFSTKYYIFKIKGLKNT
jgi:predicted RNA-binding protein YlqC (UPF0109 family)